MSKFPLVFCPCAMYCFTSNEDFFSCTFCMHYMDVCMLDTRAKVICPYSGLLFVGFVASFRMAFFFGCNQ